MFAAALLLAGVQTVLAAFEYPVGSVRSISLAGCVDLRACSPLDVYLNPACQSAGRIGVDLSLSRLYNLPDFDLASGAATVSHKALSLTGASTQLSGADYYWERSYLLAGSLGLPHRLRAGAAINHLRIQYGEGYRGLHLTSLSFGCTWDVSSTVALAAALRNLNRPHYESNPEQLPIIGDVSLSYCFTKDYSLHILQHFEENVRDRFAIAQQISVCKELALSFGIATEPTELSGGFSLGFGGFKFDYGFRDNVYLGGTHRFGLRYAR
jgi:hypothetical protein